MQTSIVVRVQAVGGKFLGPDVGYSYVTIRNAVTGETLAQGVAVGDSGQPPSQVMAGSTNSPIIGSDDQVYWLHADATTAGFPATFDITTALLIEVTAAAMINGVPSNEHVAGRARGCSRVWRTPSS